MADGEADLFTGESSKKPGQDANCGDRVQRLKHPSRKHRDRLKQTEHFPLHRLPDSYAFQSGCFPNFLIRQSESPKLHVVLTEEDNLEWLPTFNNLWIPTRVVFLGPNQIIFRWPKMTVSALETISSNDPPAAMEINDIPRISRGPCVR